MIPTRRPLQCATEGFGQVGFTLVEPPAVCEAKRCAFTLVELLVVIAIIVILLALLVGGLERALKAAERSKCGANQRSLAQTCLLYAAQYSSTLPTGSGGTAFDLRGAVAAGATADTKAAAGRGLGQMVRTGHLPDTKLGEMIHCPSLDTTSGVPVKFGMDEIYTETDTSILLAGGSFWTNPAGDTRRILGSYSYRFKSYNSAKGANLLTNKVGSGFALTCDTVTAVNNVAGARNYGRKYHHKTGWNVSYADGHVSFFPNEPSKTNAVKDSSKIEIDILGDGNTLSTTAMEGGGNDEKVYDEFKRG